MHHRIVSDGYILAVQKIGVTLLVFNLDGFTEQLCMILVFEYVWTNDS